MQLHFLHTKGADKHFPTIILMHGWSGSSKSLVGLQNSLSQKGFEVYNVDLPGFGGTELPPNPYYIDDYIDAILSFIEEQKITKPFLVGHSFGGKIALKIAATRPQLVRGIIAIGASGVEPKNSTKKKVLAQIAKAGKSAEKIPLLGLFAKPARKLFYKMLVREKDYYNSGALRETFVNIVNEHLDNLFPKINIPTLLIWGEQDKVTPLWMGQRMAELIPGAKLEVVPLNRHELPKVQPEIVSEIIYNQFGKLLK